MKFSNILLSKDSYIGFGDVIIPKPGRVKYPVEAQLGLLEPELIQKTTSVKNIERKIPDDESAKKAGIS